MVCAPFTLPHKNNGKLYIVYSCNKVAITKHPKKTHCTCYLFSHKKLEVTGSFYFWYALIFHFISLYCKNHIFYLCTHFIIWVYTWVSLHSSYYLIEKFIKTNWNKSIVISECNTHIWVYIHYFHALRLYILAHSCCFDSFVTGKWQVLLSPLIFFLHKFFYNLFYKSSIKQREDIFFVS